jgi:hypothetical protein
MAVFFTAARPFGKRLIIPVGAGSQAGKPKARLSIFSPGLYITFASSWLVEPVAVMFMMVPFLIQIIGLKLLRF